jgi:hypothetical protein
MKMHRRIRYLVYSLAAATMILPLVSAALVTSLIDGEFLSNLIIRSINQQTGGVTRIESANFSIWTGASIFGFEFTPPSRLPPAQPGSDANLEPNPVLQIESIHLRYSLLSLARLHLKVNEFRVAKIKFVCDGDENANCVSGIDRYRKANLPIQPKPPAAGVDQGLELQKLRESLLIKLANLIHIDIRTLELSDLEINFKPFHHNQFR